MDIKQKLRNFILDDEDINNILEDKLYPVRLSPVSEMPAGVYMQISANPVYSHQGNTQLVTDRFQLSFFHDKYNYGELQELISKVKNRMDEFDKEAGVQSCFFDDEVENFEEESEVFKVDLDYMISYSRSEL